ncbi:JmjC domain-containing protein [Enhygromyxa salina]|uniref:Cupin superfamily protein n=1 Tax=Enhygromyxa salina TaxID=215803 RepID=A0A2S9XPL7_9BACT|nr:cupin domain-containing protein [Enhygromyxa salina]PRP94808.1 Cupin superfamily protein [Enhygromyxa salina]
MRTRAIDFSALFAALASERGASTPAPRSTMRREIGPDAFARLIEPVGLEDFARAFGRAPLHIPGAAAKVEGLFSLEDLRAALLADREAAAADEGLLIEASFDRAAEPRSIPMVRVNHEAIGPILDAGATICVSRVERRDAQLAELARVTRAQLGYTGVVGVNCYLSHDGCGFGTHFDARAAISIQLEGSKTWRYGRAPAVEHPRANCNIDGDGVRVLRRAHGRTPEAWEQPAAPDERAFVSVTLEPGDLLCLPPGTWHRAEAHGYSLALNLFLEDRSVLDLLHVWLERELRSELEWRRPPPLVPAGAGVTTTDELWAYMRGRLGALAELLADPDRHEDTLTQLWSASTCASPQPPQPRGAVPELMRDELLEVDRRCPIRLRPARERAPTIELHAGAKSLSLPVAALPLVRELLARERFVAADALAWTDADERFAWTDVEPLLRVMVEHGLLRITRQG